MSGSSFLPFGSATPSPTPPSMDPAARLEAQISRLERVSWMNLVVAGLLLVTILVIFFAP